jgi:hypothetical protein
MISGKRCREVQIARQATYYGISDIQIRPHGLQTWRILYQAQIVPRPILVSRVSCRILKKISWHSADKHEARWGHSGTGVICLLVRWSQERVVPSDDSQQPAQVTFILKRNSETLKNRLQFPGYSLQGHRYPNTRGTTSIQVSRTDVVLLL